MEVVCLGVLEHILSVEQLLVNETGSQVARTNHKDFSRTKTRCLWLRGLHPLKELLENPHQRLEVSRTEHLRDEVPPFSQEVAGQFHRCQHQLALRVGVLAPVSAHIRGTVVEDHIALSSLQLFAEMVEAGGGGDITLEALGAWDAFDGVEVDTDDGGVEGHALASDLHPASGGGAEVDEGSGIA